MPQILYPLAPRPLPTPDHRRHLSTLPVCQLFATGRSGTTVLHALLDGHPQVWHIPYPLFFHRLFAEAQALYQVEAAGRRLTEEWWSAPLFDTTVSPHTGGTLGLDGATRILVDKDHFRACLRACAGADYLSERDLVLAIMLAYGWCLGADPLEARLVFHHLHHGDWLFPDLLIETANVDCAVAADRPHRFLANTYLLPLRRPRTGIEAYRTFARSIHARWGGDSEREVFHRSLRLLIQDWLRIAAVDRGPTPALFIKLETLKAAQTTTMEGLVGQLGIDPDHPALAALTFYGQPWLGDAYSQKSATLRPEPKAASAEEAPELRLLLALVGDIAARHGYDEEGAVFAPEAARAAARTLDCAAMTDFTERFIALRQTTSL